MRYPQQATESATFEQQLNTNDRYYSLQLGVSWEPHLFGEIRNTITQYANAAQASAATLANERLSDQGACPILFELRGANTLQQVYDATLKSFQQTLDLTRTLVETASISPQDVARDRHRKRQRIILQ